jgi:hypothetical protein
MLRLTVVACLAATAATLSALRLPPASVLRAPTSRVQRSSNPVAQQLPPGWISGVDQQSGQTYYYNEQTGQSQWEPPQGMGGQPDQHPRWTAYYGAAQPNPAVWYIFPRDGASGMLQNDYTVSPGQQQSLGCYDLLDRSNPSATLRADQQVIAPEQCVVQLAPDGSCATLYALGQSPTGYRSGPHEPWNWLQPGQSTTMYHQWKVTMDYNYPEQAVYKLASGQSLEAENAGGAAGGAMGYGQLQAAQQAGGFGQQY